MRRPIFLLLTALLAAIALAFGLGGTAIPTGAAPAAPGATDGVDTTTALVELAGDPLTISARTHPQHGKKVDFNSAAVKSERARLSAIRNDFKQWLQKNSPKTVVTNEFDVSLNAVSVQLKGASLDLLRSAPMVRSAEYESLFRPLAHQDPDLALIHADAAWTAAGGEANAGARVKVAVIDSGIDASHPCFDDTGYAAQPQLGDPDLTNNKVIVAKVFYNKMKKDGVGAEAIDSHGTHVAGTVACNAHTDAVVDGIQIPYDPSGVAPRALLGNYNVFPGTVVDAKSEDILRALEEAYTDGFDVANMSLGDIRNFGGSVMLAKSVDNLDRGNMVVAVAAGNEGPGTFTVGYPGAAQRALTAGASTVGHGIVNQLDVAGASYEMVIGEFAPLDSDLSAPLKVVSDPASGFPHGLNTACDDSPPLPDLHGTIALLGRGTCDFTVKMRNAYNAGAVGVVMVDREAAAPFTMSHNGLEPVPPIPGVMVSLASGAQIDDHDGAIVTLHTQGVYTTFPAETNRMASFSSVGPTQQDLLVKPDVVAPGADVLSSFPHTFCKTPPCWAIIGGTSMATPHLAGAAAVVRSMHPTWDAVQVRSAIVNTATEGVLRDSATNLVTSDANVVGHGLLDLSQAVVAPSSVDPVSTSFGAVSSGSGRTVSRPVVVTNLSSTAKTFTASVADDATDGVLFTVSGGSFTLAPGATQTVTVTMAASKGAADGPRQAMLRLSSGTAEVAHSVLFTFVGEGDRAPGPHLTNHNKD